MALLTVSGINDDPTFVDADGAGDTFKNVEPTELIIANDAAVARTLTVVAQSRCRFRFLDDLVKTIPPQAIASVRPFKSAQFNDAAGLVHFSFDNVTGVQVAVSRMLSA